MTGIRDYDITEDGEVPNLFDMKGVGGGGFVVSAGCCRVTEFPKGSGSSSVNSTHTRMTVGLLTFLIGWPVGFSAGGRSSTTHAQFAQRQKRTLAIK